MCSHYKEVEPQVLDLLDNLEVRSVTSGTLKRSLEGEMASLRIMCTA